MRALLPLLAALALTAGCRQDPVDTNTTVDADGDGFDSTVDCNDADAAVNSAAEEVCDGVDNDCDGVIDPSTATGALTTYADGDGDGHGDATAATTACDPPTGNVAAGDDCDDSDATSSPGAAETDCTDPVDHNCDGSVGFADADADGVAACLDCNDSDAAILPGATEVCDGADNDCDGTIDQAAVNALTWYTDADRDGFGDALLPVIACDQPMDETGTTAVASALSTDCDDTSAAIYPGASETCNDVDDNCNSVVDEDAIDVSTWYADADADGHGRAQQSVQACAAPDGFVASSDDCDDLVAATYPGATELCDQADNDCDGVVPPSEQELRYLDGDGDGFGRATVSANVCAAPSGYVASSTDCDDAAAATYPGATELCDKVDNDCDGVVPPSEQELRYRDVDGDGDGDATVSANVCAAPISYVVPGTDCDDADPKRSSFLPELPGDAIDNDCDGVDAVPLTYGVDRNSGDVWAFNAQTGDVAWTANTGGTMIDVARGPDGTLYATGFDAGAIYKISGDGLTITSLVTSGLPGVHGITYDHARDVLLVAQSTGAVSEVDPSTGVVTPLYDAGVETIGVYRFAGSDLVYAGSRSTRELLAWDPSTGLVTVVATLPYGPGLNLLVPGPHGELRTSGGQFVWSINVHTGAVRELDNHAASAYGLCADPYAPDGLILGDHLSAYHSLTPGNLPVAITGSLGVTWGCDSDIPRDADGDGFVNALLGGDDCDDWSAAVSPTSADLHGDSLDSNCDGVDGVDGDGDGEASATDPDDADAAVFTGVLAHPVVGTCKTLQQLNPSLPSGLYAIDPAGSGVAWLTACDMLVQGGGWTLAAYASDNSAGFPRMDGDVGVFDASVRSGKASMGALIIAKQSVESAFAYAPATTFTGMLAETSDTVAFEIPDPSALTFSTALDQGVCTAVRAWRLAPAGGMQTCMGSSGLSTTAISLDNCNDTAHAATAAVFTQSMGGTYGGNFGYGLYGLEWSCDNWPNISHHWNVDTSAYSWEPSATQYWAGAVNGSTSVWFR